MRILSKIIRFCVRTAFWTIVFTTAAGVGVFLTIKHGLPPALVSYAIDKLPTGDFFIRTGKVSYSFRNGLRISDLKLLRKKEFTEPIFCADDIYIKYSLLPDLTPLKSRLRSITVVAPKFPHLPKLGDSDRDQFSPELPEIPECRVTLTDLDILGIQAEKLQGTVSLAQNKASLKNATLRWHDRREGEVDVDCSVDFKKRLSCINLNGKMYPARLIPLMEPSRIDSPTVISQIRRYSGITRPVPAELDMEVDIDSADFSMTLKLDIASCSYNDTPLRNATGIIAVSQTGTDMKITADELSVTSLTGTMNGSLHYDEKVEKLEFKCTSRMDAPDFFGIIGLLDGNELEIIHCAEPPLIKGSGTISLREKQEDGAIFNNVTGSLALKRGAILNFRVTDVSTDIDLKNYTATLSDLRARPEHGGNINGAIRFLFPEYRRERSNFETDLELQDVDLRDICRAMNITNSRPGKISGTIKIKASTQKEKALSKMEGSGHIEFKDGIIAQIPIFAGLTPTMAENVPGISPLVNQSSGSLDFTIADGIIRSENIKIEGAMFSISGRGEYDIDGNRLNMILRANFFRESTLLGKITNWITFPFTKLLLEFKVTGSLENPQCSYVNIIEKIMAL